MKSLGLLAVVTVALVALVASQLYHGPWDPSRVPWTTPTPTASAKPTPTPGPTPVPIAGAPAQSIVSPQAAAQIQEFCDNQVRYGGCASWSVVGPVINSPTQKGLSFFAITTAKDGTQWGWVIYVGPDGEVTDFE